MTDTLKLEANVARAPIFAPAPNTPAQLALAWAVVPYEREPFRIVDLAQADGPLTIPDLAVFARLCTRYLWRPDDGRRVQLTLAEVAAWLGNEGPIGGTQRAQAKASLRRLCAARFESTLRRGTELEAWRNWGLLEEAGAFTRGRAAGYVTITTAVAEQLRAGAVVLVDADTAGRLLRQDPLAYRLWIWLETQRLTEPRRFALFAQDGHERRHPALADLLRLRDRPRRTVARIRRAAFAVEAIDDRYELEVGPGRRPGAWTLTARRWEKGIRGPANGHPRAGKRASEGQAGGIRLTLDGLAVERGKRASEGRAENPPSSLKSNLPSSRATRARGATIEELEERLGQEPSAEIRDAIRAQLALLRRRDV